MEEDVEEDAEQDAEQDVEQDVDTDRVARTRTLTDGDIETNRARTWNKRSVRTGRHAFTMMARASDDDVPLLVEAADVAVPTTAANAPPYGTAPAHAFARAARGDDAHDGGTPQPCCPGRLRAPPAPSRRRRLCRNACHACP